MNPSLNRDLIVSYSIAINGAGVKCSKKILLRIGSREVMDMTSQLPDFPHKLTLNERQKLTMTGVSEVVSFDEDSVVLHTNLGSLVVEGQELKLKNLSPDGGQLAIEGNIRGLFYEEPRQSRSFWRRKDP